MPPALNLTYESAINELTIEAAVGTLVPVTVDVWGVGQGQSVSLVSNVALGVTDPPTISSFSRAIPQLGIVTVFATLTTVNEEIICTDLATVNTG